MQEVSEMINLLPKGFQADLRRYSNWLENNFKTIISKVPKEKRNKIDKSTFVVLSIYKEIINYPISQIKIIKKTFNYLSKYDITSIQLRRETLEKDGAAVKSLEILIEALTTALSKSEASFILDAGSLTSLASQIAKRGFVLE
jgi:hypothetical protein